MIPSNAKQQRKGNYIALIVSVLLIAILIISLLLIS